MGDLDGADAESTLNEKTGRKMITLDNGLFGDDDKTNLLAVIASHEAQRDGVVTGDNEAETLRAVASHTAMAFKLASKYGTNWMTSGLVGDMMAALSGKASFEQYIGNNYSSEGDYHKIVEDKLVVTAGDGLGQIAKELFGMTAWNGEFTEEFKAFADALGKGDNYGLETGDEFDLSSPKVKKFIKDYYKNDPEKIAEFYESNGISLKSNMFVDAVKGALQLGKNSINWGKDKLANIKDNILGMFGPRYVDMSKYLEIDDPTQLYIPGFIGGDGASNLCTSVQAARYFEAIANKLGKTPEDLFKDILDRNIQKEFNNIIQNHSGDVFEKLPDNYKGMGLAGIIEYAGWGEMEVLTRKDFFDLEKDIYGAIGGYLPEYEYESYSSGKYYSGDKNGHAVIFYGKGKSNKPLYDYDVYLYDQNTNNSYRTISYSETWLQKNENTYILSNTYNNLTYKKYQAGLDKLKELLD